MEDRTHNYQKLHDDFHKQVQEVMMWQDEVIHNHIMSESPYATKGIWGVIDKETIYFKNDQLLLL